MALAVCVSACHGTDDPEQPEKKVIDITGTWELTRVETKAATVGSESVEVTVTFQDGKFELSQRLGSAGRTSTFTGTYTLTDNVLSGKYEDGTAWSTSYTVTVEGSTMTLETEKERDTYKKK